MTQNNAAAAGTKTALTFEEQLAILDAFVAEHGHAAVPQMFVTADGVPLGTMVKTWRRSHTSGQLSAHRRDALAARTGWVWRASKRNRTVAADGTIARIGEDPFAERIRALRLFAHEHGHTQVPTGMVTLTGVNLGLWVVSQRGMYASRQRGEGRHRWMRDDHIAALEAVPHWTWKANTSGLFWDRAFTALEDVVARTGTAFVPRSTVTEDGMQIGKWVIQQRALHRRGTLSADRAAKLEALPGWVWNGAFVNDTFDIRIAELRAFVAEHPTAAYPEVLARWASRRRTNFARGELDQHKIDTLNSIPGWSWNSGWKRTTGPTPPRKKPTAAPVKKVMATGLKPMSNTMQSNLDRIVAYAAEHGHARVPHLHVEADGMRLGLVVKNLQDRPDTLHPDMIAGLNSITGWTWSKPASWDLDEALAALDAFVVEHGHARVPRGYVSTDGFLLGNRVETWRRQALAAQLPTAVARELESKPGWLWARRSSTTLAA